jgi:hypothetical protein
MENTNRINEITKKLSELSLNISRVPSKTKKDFIGLANAEFAGDYGLCLKYVFDQALEYQYMKALFFDKMQALQDKIDTIQENLDSLSNKHEEKIPSKKRLGRIVEKEVNENE